MPYKVFLSWSGPRSKHVAEAFSAMLRGVINVATPFLSFDDIRKGDFWEGEIRNALNECVCGVVFLCRDNLNSSWLLFESGAIAKRLEKPYCCTFLIDLKPSDLRQPLGGLQHTVFEKLDVLELMKSINIAVGAGRSDADLESSLEAFWDAFREKVANAPPAATDTKPDLLDTDGAIHEILAYVRRQAERDGTSSYVNQAVLAAAQERAIVTFATPLVEGEDAIHLVGRQVVAAGRALNMSGGTLINAVLTISANFEDVPEPRKSALSRRVTELALVLPNVF